MDPNLGPYVDPNLGTYMDPTFGTEMDQNLPSVSTSFELNPSPQSISASHYFQHPPNEYDPPFYHQHLPPSSGFFQKFEQSAPNIPLIGSFSGRLKFGQWRCIELPCTDGGQERITLVETRLLEASHTSNWMYTSENEVEERRESKKCETKKGSPKRAVQRAD